jgi:hypothetical protein
MSRVQLYGVTTLEQSRNPPTSEKSCICRKHKRRPTPYDFGEVICRKHKRHPTPYDFDDSPRCF